MKKKRSFRFKLTGVKKQMIRIYFLAAVLPILVLGTFSIFQVRRQMMEHYSSQVEADGLRVNSILFDITTSIFTSTEPFTENQDYMRLFGSKSFDSAKLNTLTELNDAIDTLRDHTASVSSIHLYTNNPSVPDTDYIIGLSNYNDLDWHEAIGNGWNTWTCLSREDRFGNDNYELTLIRQIGTTSSAYSAYLVIRLDSNYIKNRLEQNQYQITTALDDLPVFYASDTSLLKKTMIAPEDFNGEFYRYTGSLDIRGKKTLSSIITFRPYKTDNLFFITISDTSVYNEINRITYLYLGILFIGTFVPAVIIVLYSSHFSRRISVLKHAMHQASLGDYNIINTFKGDDELKETFDDLKTTVEKIHEKEARYYETLLHEQQLINKQQEMEFKMLASQINPHFLYNTLETIRMQALANGNKDVATSIKLLGKSMHYVLENTGTTLTTLTNELDYVKTYLSIQQLRFGDRANAVFEIDEAIDTDEIRILPLLLQPVVENAIIHGLENVKENGYITIRIFSDEEFFTIVVSDNGPGMDKNTLLALQDKVAHHDKNDTRSIGLFNIDQRIKLLYGKDYGLSIDSTLGEGTTVRIQMPATL